MTACLLYNSPEFPFFGRPWLMTDLLRMLHDERATLAKRLVGIDAAIAAPNGAIAPKKRVMSAAARAKISAAQKKRWAKAKK
jgi:hypothetical protein